jgi:hypothetical protein
MLTPPPAAAQEAESAESDDEEWARNVTAGKLSKGDKLAAVDHATMNYPPFRKSFYIETPDIKRMTDEQTAALRKEFDGIKVRGLAGVVVVLGQEGAWLSFVCVWGLFIWWGWGQERTWHTEGQEKTGLC